MNLRRIWDRFSRRTVAVVLVFAVIGAGAGILRMYLKDYNYTATATVYVTPPISSSASDALTADQYAANRTQLYLSLIESPELARAVLDRLKSDQSPADLAERVQAKATPQTSLLSITASGSSPSDARDLATAYAEGLSSFARTVEGSAGLRGSPSVITVASPVAKDPSFVQQYGLILALMAGVGLLGALYSYSYRRRYPNVRSTDQLRRELHVALAETVDVGNPAPKIRRLQAELLTDAPNDGGLMVVGARERDQTSTLSDLLSQSIKEAGRDGRATNGSRRGAGRGGGFVIVDVPALLESSASAAALHRDDCRQAVIVTRYDTTSLRDAKEVLELLRMNDVVVRGAIMLRREGLPWQRNSAPSDQAASGDDDSEFPWPAIDVLEAEKRGRPVRAD